MTTYKVFRVYYPWVKKYRQFQHGIEKLGVVIAEDDYKAIHEACKRYEPSDYFPRPDGSIVDRTGYCLYRPWSSSLRFTDYVVCVESTNKTTIL